MSPSLISLHIQDLKIPPLEANTIKKCSLFP